MEGNLRCFRSNQRTLTWEMRPWTRLNFWRCVFDTIFQKIREYLLRVIVNRHNPRESNPLRWQWRSKGLVIGSMHCCCYYCFFFSFMWLMQRENRKKTNVFVPERERERENFIFDHSSYVSNTKIMHQWKMMLGTPPYSCSNRRSTRDERRCFTQIEFQEKIRMKRSMRFPSIPHLRCILKEKKRKRKKRLSIK